MAKFTVTATREINTLNEANTMVSVKRVWITTENGSTGQVDIPTAKWNIEDVARILATKAEELDLAFVISSAQE